MIKQQLRHADYRECIYEYKKCVHSMNMIRSEKHKVFTIIQNKTTLSAYDDKRYILDDGMHFTIWTLYVKKLDIYLFIYFYICKQ